MESQSVKYRDCLSIDPTYVPCVDDEVIYEESDLWKKFYPHQDFVRLVEYTIAVLSRNKKLSVWVEGSYGTGKSHAVLTLKKLLDADEKTTSRYFDNYAEELSSVKDLRNRFLQEKRGKKILTVQRYGASTIKGDFMLVSAMQRSIIQALKQNGLQGTKSSFKEAILARLSEKVFRDTLDGLIKKDGYLDHHDELHKLKGTFRFYGVKDAETLIKKLNNGGNNEIESLIGAVIELGDKVNVPIFSFSVDDFKGWVKGVIKDNDLKAIVFIWDEFTEYFTQNLDKLSGFQSIAHLSATAPFYLFIVTHRSTGLFDNADGDQKKILDRFIRPTCKITLPENMAFHLMGQAWKINENSSAQWDWQEDLYKRTESSRGLIKKGIGYDLSDKDLKAILPIHPYAALFLKQMFSVFESNQRSMFKFIKDNLGDKMKGFQWFIDNYGPGDDNPLLTIDMLWDYFNGIENLPRDVRSILDYFSTVQANLSSKEKRVLKTVILLQAVSQHSRDSYDLFKTNEKNINNAFDGTDMELREPARIADKLCRDKILYSKAVKIFEKGTEKGTEKQYFGLSNVFNSSSLEKYRNNYINNSASDLFKSRNLDEEIKRLIVPGALNLRYKVDFMCAADLNKKDVGDFSKDVNEKKWKIGAIVALAKNDAEKTAIEKAIDKLVDEKGEDYQKNIEDYRKVVFIDSSIPLGQKFDDYVEALAEWEYSKQSGDESFADICDENVKKIFKEWEERIESGNFRIRYYEDGKFCDFTVNSANEVCNVLKEFDKKLFEFALETGPIVNDKMWDNTTNVKQGAECGINGTLSGVFKSDKQMDLGKYIGDDVWGKPRDFKYWEEKPNCLISKIKLKVISVVNEGFTKHGRVAISTIYDELSEPPFGFMPCNLTAFVMGFVLRDYADSIYSYGQDATGGEELTSKKLAEMIGRIFKKNSSIKEYIVKHTVEEKSFFEASSKVFGIPLANCVNIESTRVLIRTKMNEKEFPFWFLKYALNESTNDKAYLESLIDLYLGVVNDGNSSSGKNAHDIAVDAGKLCLDHPDLAAELESISKASDRYIDGVKAYANAFDKGRLANLAKSINDKGQYVYILKEKFNKTEASKWAWGQKSINDAFEEVILEYSIIVASNEVNDDKTKSFDACMSVWLDKLKNIRISYEAAADEDCFEDGKEFFKMMYDMKKQYDVKKSNMLLDFDKQQLQKFYDLLTANKQTIKNLFDKQMQLEMLKKIGNYHFTANSFNDAEIKEIYEKFLPINCWTMAGREYNNLIKEKCDEFETKSAAAKLKKIWRDKTGTESPREWSYEHKMPILCIIDDKYVHDAQKVFDVIGQKSDINTVNEAIKFLESAAFYDKLNSEEECDKAFRKKIIRDYDVLLTDIKEVKNYLFKSIGEYVYNWFEFRDEVDKKLYEMAKAKYDEIGYEKALKKIDSMNADDAKYYLKDLIGRDIHVGMKIIKEK